MRYLYGGRITKKALSSIMMIGLILVIVFQAGFSANAINFKNEEIVDKTQKELVINIGQPDLTITDFSVTRNYWSGDNKIWVHFKNIGDKATTEKITVTVDCYFWFFILPILIKRLVEVIPTKYPLEPGETDHVYFYDTP